MVEAIKADDTDDSIGTKIDSGLDDTPDIDDDDTSDVDERGLGALLAFVALLVWARRQGVV